MGVAKRPGPSNPHSVVKMALYADLKDGELQPDPGGQWRPASAAGSGGKRRRWAVAARGAGQRRRPAAAAVRDGGGQRENQLDGRLGRQDSKEFLRRESAVT